VIDLGKSRTRDAVVRELFAEPRVEWHVRGLARQTGEAVANVHRELRRLEAGGWLVRRREANRVLYGINRAHPLYPEMRSMVAKTVGVGRVLAAALAEVPGVEYAAYLEGAGGGWTSVSGGLRLVVIGPADPATVAAALRPAAQWLARPLPCEVYGVDVVRRAISRRDPHLMDLLAYRRVVIVGSERGLRGLVGGGLVPDVASV